MTEFEHDGYFYLTEGLVYLWWNPKVVAKEHFFSDPPKLNAAVKKWLKNHPEVTYFPTPFVGPPQWKFPTAELRQEFKDTFLESAERMEEIIAEGVAKKRAEEHAEWIAQGRRRCEAGHARITKTFKRGKKTETYDIIVFPDPETGAFLGHAPSKLSGGEE